MSFTSRILLSTAGVTAVSLSLTACAGAPAPCTEPDSIAATQAAPATESEHNKEQAAATPAAAPAATPTKNSVAPDAQPSASQPHPVATTEKKPAEAKPVENVSSSSVTAAASSDAESLGEANLAALVSAAQEPADPYTAFPALASATFEHADSLYRQGQVDEAVAYLQRFRVIKPLWNQWESQADSMLAEFGKTNAERAKQYEPMVLEIQNMNRARSSYSLVAEVADSLIAMAPGDSLVKFANQQKQIAFNNTLGKASKEKENIQKLATEQAKFAEAEQKAIEFQMRYRDFEDALKIQAMIDEIRELASANDAEAAAYWQKNDPAAALARARELSEQSKFAEAKALLTKLKASTLRKEAIEEYGKLADSFCNAQRKITSQIFGKAQKQKDPAKKADLLKDAIAPLDKCLSEYPENSQKQKVIDNKKFLERELSK